MRWLWCGFIGAAVMGYAQPHCFQWQFETGRALRVHVEAQDTIAISGEPTLFRDRIERWQIVCDSTRGDTAFLRQTLEHYWAREWTDRGDSSTRTTLPHSSTPTYFAVTSRGWRISAHSTSRETIHVVPGSVFGPVFFVPLDSHCTLCGGTQWLVEQRDTLVEYAYPPAVVDRLYLSSADSCTDEGVPRIISFAETSRGFHHVRTGTLTMQTAVWMLAHGVVELDTAKRLPKRLFYANQQRLLIEQPTGNRSHRGSMRTTLSATVDIIPLPTRR